MSAKYFITFISFVFATAVCSNENMENAAFKARMQAMTSMSINMRILGKMMKGIQDFDLDIARASIGNIAVLASETPELFKIEAVDPNAEAKLEVWTNFDDFIEKAMALESAAPYAGNILTSKERLRNAVISLGGTCKACHSFSRN